MDTQVHGQVADGWEAVRAEFEANFADRGEVGASVCVTHQGETVVDLWGGTIDKQGTPWEEDTLVTVFSSTKGGVALAAHLLADSGELDLDAPVAELWPEFATRGKEQVTNKMMLNHTAGVPTFKDPLPPGAATNWDLMCDRLAAEEPWWEPGTRNGYHMITYGWTAGELVRRASGRSLGTFFAEEVAGPAGADFHIGLPESEHGRVAKVITYRARPGEEFGEFTQALLADRKSLQNKAWLNQGDFDPNSPDTWSAEIGGGGGVSNGRGMAAVYRAAALGDFVGEQQARRMSRVSVATERDATLLLPTRFGEGFMLSMDNRRRPFGDVDSAIIGHRAFGHVGAGGSIGFADPDLGMSMGYAMNQMGKGILMNDRGQSLVDA
ncbi:MAG: serine hydrolase, partial [Actinomycetota bacterium]|nr:serine hydrolase [Actinomycetota bacterium]